MTEYTKAYAASVDYDPRYEDGAAVNLARCLLNHVAKDIKNGGKFEV